jgi:hypothetical protein
MDESLRELERRFQADPSDRAVARKYEDALRRASDQAGLAELYRLAFQCPMRWTDLNKTSSPLVRHCDRCDREVRFTSHPESFAQARARGQCVAVLGENKGQHAQDLAEAGAEEALVSEGSPCLVDGVEDDPDEIISAYAYAMGMPPAEGNDLRRAVERLRDEASSSPEGGPPRGGVRRRRRRGGVLRSVLRRRQD